MELTLRREDFTAERTIGRLFVDGVFQCWTLEDTVRTDDPSTPQDEGAKVPGKTAIPAGRYAVTMYRSPKHGLVLLLHNVPGFSFIEIHAGNAASDTRGCILVGEDRAVDVVLQSKKALSALLHRIAPALAKREPVWITVQ